MTDFVARLYSAIAERSQSDIFFSPLSIGLVLGMVTDGSENATKTQLLSLLSVSDQQGR